MHVTHPPRHRRRAIALGVAATIAAWLALAGVPPAAAVEPASGLTIEGRALLGGNVRPGAWAAVTVTVANDGPSLSGELRIRTPQEGRSVYGIPVELPSSSRQVFTLYAQPPLFGSLLHVDLVSGGRVVQTINVTIRSHDTYAPIIALIAERPEGLLSGITGAARDEAMTREGVAPVAVTIRVEDLPERVEAWSAIDRLVWQDIDPRRLSAGQADALRQWIAAGGHLVVLGGSSGITTVSGFEQGLLPISPRATVDVAADDIFQMLGHRPTGVESSPAVAGTLTRGNVWGRSGDHVIAADAVLGQGRVTMFGINPAERWISDGEAGRALWRRLLSGVSGVDVGGLGMGDDSQMVAALNNLPSIDLPPIEQLFLLLFAYVALIGPVNYLVLRRLDRREWAWLTMPALVGIFAVGSYGMGASLKGSDVIVNELAVIRVGEGVDEGIAQVYVGVFSPARRTFEVRIADGALLSNANSQSRFGQAERPLDVVFGEPSRVRNFEVGFAALRSFRAQSATAAPRIESDLRLSQGRLTGTVSNRSETPLQHVAVSYANGVAVIGDLAPGASVNVSLDTNGGAAAGGWPLSEKILGQSLPRDEAQARSSYTRRAVLDQISAYGPGVQGVDRGTPLLLAWRPGPVLDVELSGERPNRVGDSLIMVPLGIQFDRHTVFGDQLLSRTVVSSTGDVFFDPGSMGVGRGSVTVELRPGAFEGSFSTGSLSLAMSAGDVQTLRGNGSAIAPLPDDQQPDQDDPVGAPDSGTDPIPAPMGEVPHLQLFDRTEGRWYEFPRFTPGREYRIEQPERYVDSSGRFLLRLVNRSVGGEMYYFSLLARLEGSIE